MTDHKIFRMPFDKVYPLYVEKARKKGRTEEEVNHIIFWLTGDNQESLQDKLNRHVDFTTFFQEAPKLNENRHLITGVICGYRVEEIEEPLIQNIRYLDKLIDELAKGKSMDKILREGKY